MYVQAALSFGLETFSSAWNSHNKYHREDYYTCKVVIAIHSSSIAYIFMGRRKDDTSQKRNQELFQPCTLRAATGSSTLLPNTIELLLHWPSSTMTSWLPTTTFNLKKKSWISRTYALNHQTGCKNGSIMT